MANANNQALRRPGAPFQEAGNIIFKFRHPFLTGQLGAKSTVDEVDVSRSLQLNSNFFQANPAQDSAHQEALVDGSVVTITNHLMNGQITLQALSTTGVVGTGDFIACAHLIIASGDNVGGTFTVIRNFDNIKRIRVYYGLSFKNVPHELIAGNTVVPYPMVMLYASWVEGLGAVADNRKIIWAVGNKYGLDGKFDPYTIDGVPIDRAEADGLYDGEPFPGVDNAGTDDTIGKPGGIHDDDFVTENYPDNVTGVSYEGPEGGVKDEDEDEDED
jgi:hypothetical protein